MPYHGSPSDIGRAMAAATEPGPSATGSLAIAHPLYELSITAVSAKLHSSGEYIHVMVLKLVDISTML